MGIIGITEAGLVLSDNTTANASTTKHGLAPKYPNDATKYLDGTGAYSVPAGGGGTGLTATSLQTGAYTAANLDLVLVSANGAAANFAVSLPASPSNGDRVGVLMVAQHATRKVTVSLNGGSFVGTIGKYDLVLDGDFVIFQYNSTLAKWFVEHDGIMPHRARYALASNTSGNEWTAGSLIIVPWGSGDVELDVGGIADYANDGFTIRRAGEYQISAVVQAVATSNQANAACRTDFYDGTKNRYGGSLVFPSGITMSASGSALMTLADAALLVVKPLNGDNINHNFVGSDITCFEIHEIR